MTKESDTERQAGDFMALAFRQAELAAGRDEVPIGAVLVDSVTGTILAADHNRVEEWQDPTAHAELLVIRRAAMASGEKRLPMADLYVTLEPCPMCATAIAFARLRRVIYAASDPKGGGIEHGPRIFTQPTCHHRPQVFGGLDEGRSAEMLRSFFRAKR
ncbi:nucleoside deaminase [Dongia soli]|uniref:tRNA-specific adenosine deaminase n=1 Tax=Dongia soli TaxID=600628 RepID=A0ABU5ED68_9PROT|nr:nucleoside deaminase [Dongia soli]MDY0884294.1 nucleoside deaminase [Dongia soli]